MGLEEKYTDNKEMVDFLFELVKMIATYGVPATIQIIKSLNNNVISKERIEAAFLDKKPIEFFPCMDDEGTSNE